MADIQYLHLPAGAAPPAFPAQPFKVVLVIEQPSASDWRAAVCARVAESGCVYAVAWGQDCELWHDAVDWANLEAFDFGDIPEDRFIMTTWHADEPLSEAFWFTGFCATHPTLELDLTILLHIAAEARGADLIAQYHAAQERD